MSSSLVAVVVSLIFAPDDCTITGRICSPTDRPLCGDVVFPHKRHGNLHEVCLLVEAAADKKTKKPTNRLPEDGTLKRGESLVSNNGKYRLIMENNSGNVSLRRTADNKVLWARVTKGRGVDLHLQKDGNLILRGAKRKPLWTTRTAGHKGTLLELQDDGNLVLYARGRRALWASGTKQRVATKTTPKPNRKEAIAAELKRLRGTWAILGAEADGKQLPKDPKAKAFVFRGNELRGFVPGMTYAIDPTKTPRHLDLIVKRSGVTVVTKAIYKLEKDTLSICIPLVEEGKGADHERPKDFTTKGRKVILIRTARKTR